MCETFTSADGSTRCVKCHLHPDLCTCDPTHPMRVVAAACLRVMAGEPREIVLADHAEVA